MDDMQSRDEASNDKIAEDLLIWMFGTLIKARDYKKCLVVFLGNMYPYDGSILKKLKYNPMWKSLICGAILADGESIWPEFRSVESLLEELENDTAIGHREIFYAEIMNDENASGSSGVNLNKIPSYPVEFDSIQPTGGFIVIDPASGKKQGDDVAIGVNFIVEGKPVFKYLKTGTFTPSETIKEALSLALQYSIPLICVEAVAYQSTLLHWFGVVCESLGISGIFLEELSPKNTAKNTRIKNGLIAVVKGEIILHPEVKSHVIHQAVNWDPHKVNNKDDILDLVAYIPQVMEKYLELTRFLHKPNLYELEVEASFTEDLQLAF
jgi:hypothetical protein